MMEQTCEWLPLEEEARAARGMDGVLGTTKAWLSTATQRSRSRPRKAEGRAIVVLVCVDGAGLAGGVGEADWLLERGSDL